MYKYETHLHTLPVSGCARASVEENLEFYKSLGYDGVFITNHFLDSNIGIDRNEPYEKKINFFFSDVEHAKAVGAKIGLKVFEGAELSNGGTDFLIYGLYKDWYLEHPEIMEMEKSEELAFMKDAGALVVQAHPFREANYIDHIRLYPRHVHAVETINACRTDFENEMADRYAEAYGLLKVAGSDNHTAGRQKKLAGMMCNTPLTCEEDYIKGVLSGTLEMF